MGWCDLWLTMSHHTEAYIYDRNNRLLCLSATRGLMCIHMNICPAVIIDPTYSIYSTLIYTVYPMKYVHGFIARCASVELNPESLINSCDVILIFFEVASRALGQSYDYPSASEATLKDMGNIGHYITITKYNNSLFLTWPTIRTDFKASFAKKHQCSRFKYVFRPCPFVNSELTPWTHGDLMCNLLVSFS